MKTKTYKNSKDILIYKDGEFIKKCKSMTEAANFIGAKVQNIYKSLNGYKTTLNGYTVIKDTLEIQDVLKFITGNRNYIYNIDLDNNLIEYGDLKFDNTFYIDTVGTITFNELTSIMRDKRIDVLLEKP